MENNQKILLENEKHKLQSRIQECSRRIAVTRDREQNIRANLERLNFDSHEIAVELQRLVCELDSLTSQFNRVEQCCRSVLG